MQKNNRELEAIVQDCILNAIRESVPTEAIIRAYMDESIEQEEEVIIENIEEPVTPVTENPQVGGNEGQDTTIMKEDIIPSLVPSIQNIDNEDVITRLSFNDLDSVLDESNAVKTIEAPKTIERLEEISTNRAIQRKLEEEESSDDEDDKIHIHTDTIDLSGFDVLDNDKVDILSNDFMLDGVEELA